jgi:hypothetical protein
MNEFLSGVPFSFGELEEIVWQNTLEVYRETLVSVLEAVDRALQGARDPERYVLKDQRPRDLMTKVGPIQFRRRYYWDREEERWVALLDELLGLEERKRFSRGVRAEAVEAAITGNSYRGARAELERRDSRVVVSHEAIRQWTQKVGEALKRHSEERRASPAGTRRVTVLFVEADGFWLGMQGRPKQEARLLVTHEGWEPRSTGSEEYRLVERKDFVFEGKGDPWAEFAAWLESEYDLTETWVVINGDRAPWIRKGVEWFVRAMYQIDRFHLLRDLQRVLRPLPEHLKEAQEMLNRNDAEGLLAVLRDAAVALSGNDRARREVLALYNDLRTIPEAIRDYRVRLAERGVSVEGLRGLGAAESSVERYSRRLRKVGRSWSPKGLSAMLHVMAAYFQGALRGAVQVVERMLSLPPLSEARIRAKQRAATTVGSRLDYVRSGHLPALERGRTATGGLSKLLRAIING